MLAGYCERAVDQIDEIFFHQCVMVQIRLYMYVHVCACIFTLYIIATMAFTWQFILYAIFTV